MNRCFQNRCSGVHVLSGDPGYAGGEPVKGDPLRLCFFNGGGSDPLVGMAIAFIVSVLVIRFLMGYIKKHDFKVFGWYRIVLGILVLLYFFVIK